MFVRWDGKNPNFDHFQRENAVESVQAQFVKTLQFCKIFFFFFFFNVCIYCVKGTLARMDSSVGQHVNKHATLAIVSNTWKVPHKEHGGTLMQSIKFQQIPLTYLEYQ